MDASVGGQSAGTRVDHLRPFAACLNSPLPGPYLLLVSQHLRVFEANKEMMTLPDRIEVEDIGDAKEGFSNEVSRPNRLSLRDSDNLG